jgi:hypothetical protein
MKAPTIRGCACGDYIEERFRMQLTVMVASGTRACHVLKGACHTLERERGGSDDGIINRQLLFCICMNDDE